MKNMTPNKILGIALLIPILVSVVPHVYASESNSKRYNDGFSNGAQAAATDKQQGNPSNPTCDPTGRYTSDGQHSTIYCNGWANGYASTSDGQHSTIYCNGWANGYASTYNGGGGGVSPQPSPSSQENFAS
jgi:hypothetical protein